ncbi:MAG: hypothetical protein ABSD21_04880 [Rhizomicrobium sp.]|jgi:hypothetical protein
MATIEVDFEVFKQLTARRETEETTYNEVIRQLLKLPPQRATESARAPSQLLGWTSKGVLFPNGTEFRATYKGTSYSAKVEGNKLLLNDKAMNSPSEAATAITKNSVNGWVFWECKRPNEGRWRRLDSIAREQRLDGVRI